MDYSKALNAELGVEDKPIAVKGSAAKSVSVRKEVQLKSAVDSSNEVQFNASDFVIRESLIRGLALYVGSKLEIAKNGAVTFIFGKVISK